MMLMTFATSAGTRTVARNARDSKDTATSPQLPSWIELGPPYSAYPSRTIQAACSDWAYLCKHEQLQAVL
jgi:hypothetical protein